MTLDCMTFKVIKSGTNRKLLYDLLLVVYIVTFADHVPFTRNLMRLSNVMSLKHCQVIDSRISYESCHVISY